MIWPTLEVERKLFAAHDVVIGIDEVGRGAIAGPLVVGAAAWPAMMTSWPEWLRDSKTLSPARRSQVVAELADKVCVGLGWVDPDRIDEVGIVAALAEAAVLAVDDLARKGVSVSTAHVLLDGSHDWLSGHLAYEPALTVRAKADRDCVSVAAAACFAKVARDSYMAEIAGSYPHYAWERNKGYGTGEHMQAIQEHGPTGHHRLTWLHGET